MYPDGDLSKLKICNQFSTLCVEYNIVSGYNLSKTYEDRIQKIKHFKGRFGTICATTKNVINNFNLNANWFIYVLNWLL